MKTALKLIFVILILLGLTFSVLNFISVKSYAGGPGKDNKNGSVTGTLQSNGDCLGDPTNC